MTYFKDLDEYSSEQLQNELNRRSNLLQQGLCDYCGQKGSDRACRFPSRHKEAARKWHRSWKISYGPSWIVAESPDTRKALNISISINFAYLFERAGLFRDQTLGFDVPPDVPLYEKAVYAIDKVETV